MPKAWHALLATAKPKDLPDPETWQGGLSIKRWRHSPEQVIRKLRDVDRMLSDSKGIAETCQALEAAEATFHSWRNQYGWMKADEAKRLKEIQI